MTIKTSHIIGISGYSGYSGLGLSGYSGISGYSSLSGFSGYSGISGYSGLDGRIGIDGVSGFSGYSGIGISGYSGLDGRIGVDGISGFSGYSGIGISGFSGYSGTTNIFLGAPTTGDYTAGLFPWVINTTLIADAEQSVNNVLAALAPAPAPNFSQFNNAQTGVTGKLSYGAGQSIGGVTNVSGIGSASPVNTAVNVDESFTVSGLRRGIFSGSQTTYTGQLASNVAAGSGTPTPAYLQYAFLCDSDQGTLKIYVNDDINPKHTLDLSGFTGPGSSVNANGTGFTSVSVITSECFPNGNTFTLFQYRTSQWVVGSSDCTEGWNWVRITHTVPDAGVDRPAVKLYCDFVIDLNITATSFSSELLNGFSGTGLKYLSGVKYYTGGSASYAITINNLYRNTYYSSSDAIAYGNNGTPLQAISNESLSSCGGDETLAVTKSKTANITASGVRLNPTAGSTITLKTTAKRTVQTTQISTGSSIANILLDNVAASSTISAEGFDDEVYRMLSNADFDNNTTAVVSSWTSANSIANAGNVGYNNGLQVYNSSLIYPSTNFSTISNGPTSNVDYSGGVCTGIRYYYRFCDMTPTARSNFTLTVTGTATPRSSSYTMTTNSNDIKIDIKLPNNSSEGTGWLDATVLFATGQWTDGKGCLLSGSFAMNSAKTVTVGTKSTGSVSVNGKVFVRITVPQGWSGNLTALSLVGA